jgi:hypothetical protein
MSFLMIKIGAWAICGLAALTLLWDASDAPEGMSKVSAQTSYATIPLGTNGFWCTPSAYWPQGWLQAKGILKVCDELFDPKVNLIASLAVWHNSNWKPWNLPK